MDSLPIRKVINQIANGAIRIPSFQRGEAVKNLVSMEK